MLIQLYKLTGTLIVELLQLPTCNHLPDKYQLLNQCLDCVHSFFAPEYHSNNKGHVKQELECEMGNQSKNENRMGACSFHYMYYRGPCILRTPFQPEKYGFKLEVILK